MMNITLFIATSNGLRKTAVCEDQLSMGNSEDVSIFLPEGVYDIDHVAPHIEPDRIPLLTKDEHDRLILKIRERNLRSL